MKFSILFSWSLYTNSTTIDYHPPSNVISDMHQMLISIILDTQLIIILLFNIFVAITVLNHPHTFLHVYGLRSHQIPNLCLKIYLRIIFSITYYLDIMNRLQRDLSLCATSISLLSLLYFNNLPSLLNIICIFCMFLIVLIGGVSIASGSFSPGS